MSTESLTYQQLTLTPRLWADV